MKSRSLALLAAIAAMVLTGAVQGKKFVGSLRSTAGEFLAERDGQLVLVKGDERALAKIEGVRRVWHVNAPTLYAGDGRFLAIEQNKTSATIRLAREKSDATKWVIEIVESEKPKHPQKGSLGERELLTGDSRARFRLSVFDGPFKGFYLAAEKLPDEPPASTKPDVTYRGLKVVESAKQALLLDYFEASYFIEHK